MKVFALMAITLIFSLSVTAQTRIDARDIIRQINDGKNVSYTGTEISGDLDLTNLNNRRNTKSSHNWFGYGNDLYESTVEVSLSFVNCTFTGDVIAYYHVEQDDDTYVAHFDRDVVFKGCTFKRASEFKYSEFDGLADFSGSTFDRNANFKYAEFSDGPSFANCRFEDDADFKYTEFPRNTSFERTTFYGHANFKYTKFATPLNVSNIAFNGSEDFKYTKVDGQSFTSYLLRNK